jgi:hypothetical protein
LIGSRKLEKIPNLLCPTDGKTTNPGLPKALAGQADLKVLFLHKVLSRPWPAAGQARRDDTLYPLVVF